MIDITKQIVKPTDCVMFVAIPTDRSSFFDALLSPANRDFVPNICPIWPEYRQHVAASAGTVLRAICSMGVEVVRNASFPQFASTVANNRHTAAILFAHWLDSGRAGEFVEFADGLVNTTKIVKAIPTDLRLILDLCVCHPVTMAHQVETRSPECVVKFTRAKATPVLWFYFYLALFRTLQDSDLTYLEGLEQTIDLFLTQGTRHQSA